jgi:hypothetical protein
MGLDMYMNLKTSSYLKNDERTVDLDNPNEYNLDDCHFNEFGCSNRVEISETVAYWRKANQIHKWFVDNVQSGEDDCGEYDVSRREIQDLTNLLYTIIDKLDGKEFVRHTTDTSSEEEKSFIFDKTKLREMYSKMTYRFDINDDELKDYCCEVLPPQDGCFFGSTDINSWYFQDIIKTVLMFDELQKRIKKLDEKKVFYYLTYQASW